MTRIDDEKRKLAGLMRLKYGDGENAMAPLVGGVNLNDVGERVMELVKTPVSDMDETSLENSPETRVVVVPKVDENKPVKGIADWIKMSKE